MRCTRSIMLAGFLTTLTLMVAACGGDDESSSTDASSSSSEQGSGGGSDTVADTAVDAAGSDDNAAVATAAMAEFLAQVIPDLTIDEATCLAAGMVDDLGADQLLDGDGQPLDYANIEGPLGDAFAASLDEAATDCGVQLVGG